LVEIKDGAFAIVTIALLISMGVNVAPDDTHYCKAREYMTYHCDSLSKYYNLPNGKCIHNTLPNKLCRSGWQKIEKMSDTIFVSDGIGLPFKEVDLNTVKDFGEMRECMLNKTYCGIEADGQNLKIYVSSVADCNPLIGNETKEELIGKHITICNTKDMIIQNEK